jgi:Abnormal spindle-like microcephaly-assoc'd, ASPM-SPD-2-Hydin
MKDSTNCLTWPTGYRALWERARRCRLSIALAVGLLGASSSVGCAGVVSEGGRGQLAPSLSSISFGNVVVGNTSSQPITVTNTGNASASISQINVSGTGFSTSGPRPPLTLTPGQSTSVIVVFAPAGYGSFTGSVSMVSSATNSPAVISLSGSSYANVLNWVASKSTVVGYNVYRGTQSGGPYTKLNSSLIMSTTFTDTSVEAGQTYFYVVRAVDSSNVESIYSNQASATVPP